MKNGKKIFILVETFLGLMVFVLVMFMFLEKNEKKQEKISVIIQNSDDSQWAAFKYGAKMAAAYKEKFGYEAEFYVVDIGVGASRLDV